MKEEYYVHKTRRVANLNPKSQGGGGYPCSYGTKTLEMGQEEQHWWPPSTNVFGTVGFVRSGFSECGISRCSVTDRDSFSSFPFTGS